MMNTKNIFTTLCLLMVLTLIGCSDSEDQASIEGKWMGSRADVKVISSGITLYNDTDDSFNAVVEFKKDGTVTLNRDGQISNGTYEVNGKELTTTLNFFTDFPDLAGTFTIETLTQGTLQLYVDKDGATNIPNVGNVNGTVKGTLYFTRVP